MNAAKQALWMLASLIALACAGWYFATSNAPDIRLNMQTLASMEDISIINLNVKQFNENGLLTTRLNSPLVKHIPKRNTHLLMQPMIYIKQNDNLPGWEINALHARAVDGGKKITFNKEVVIHQPASDHNQENTLKTEQLIYYPDKKYATTTKLVTFIQPGSIVTSTGMNAWLEEKRIQLLNRPRINYEPKKKTN